MAWKVKIYYTKEEREKQEDWYSSRGYNIPKGASYKVISISIDTLSDIIDVFKEQKIDLRELLKKDFNDYEYYKLGKDIYQFNMSCSNIKPPFNELKYIVTTNPQKLLIDTRFYVNLGKAVRKAYISAEKCPKFGCKRNDGKWRYFCKYKIGNLDKEFYNILCAEHVRYPGKMVNEVLTYRSLSNITYVIAEFEKIWKINFKELSKLSYYESTDFHSSLLKIYYHIDAVYDCLFHSYRVEEVNRLSLIQFAFVVCSIIKEDMEKLPELLSKLQGMQEAVRDTEYERKYFYELQDTTNALSHIYGMGTRILETAPKIIYPYGYSWATKLGFTKSPRIFSRSIIFS